MCLTIGGCHGGQGQNGIKAMLHDKKMLEKMKKTDWMPYHA